MATAILMLWGLVSCDSKQTEVESHVTTANHDEVLEAVSQEAKELERFKNDFLAILANKDLMQSALAGRVETLCDELTLELLSPMLEVAAEQPPPEINARRWRFGFNQLMAVASQRLGVASSQAFYRLASNSAASSEIRDYASQHYLRSEALELRRLLAIDELRCRDRLNQVLDQSALLVADAPPQSGTLPGTTLLGLTSLAMELEGHPDLHVLVKRKVAELVMPVFQDDEHPCESLRSASIQAAGRLRIDDAAGAILNVAMDRKASTHERIAAIHSLKYFPSLLTQDHLDNMSVYGKHLKFAKQRLVDHWENESK